MNHLLLCTDDSGVGGVGQYNHALVCHLARRGYRVTVVKQLVDLPADVEIQMPPDVDAHLIREQINLGIEHRQVPFKNLMQAWRSLLTDPEVCPDLILCSNSNPFANFPVRKVALELDIPYLIIEGLVEPYLADHPELIPLLPQLADQYQQAREVIAVSQDNLNWLHQRFGLPLDRGRVIHYGRPDPYFAAPNQAVRDRLRQELGIPDDGIVCLTTARIETRKGYQYQITAIQQLRQSPIWPQLYFVWVGGGLFEPALEAQLKAIVAQQQLEDHVKFMGQRSNIVDWLDMADIFIFPSQLEGMPMCVMEAMAKGLPVIASAVSGIPEELGDTGQLLPDPKTDADGTVRELVQTLEQWVAHPEMRRQLGRASQQRADQLFRETRMLQQTTEVIERALMPPGDYVSPGLAIVRPDACFPNLTIGDPIPHPWPYLRRDIPHNWYVDQRRPIVGFLSRDEAHILYNTALQFKGKRALEIGCWMGWSACHLALAGVQLDVIDPELGNPPVYDSVRDSLERAGVLESVRLLPGHSPGKVEELAQQEQGKWSLIFIDGDHEVPGPLQDAIACEPLAEEDALIVFHDLTAPAVAQGLDYLRSKGWQTLVYQTMQIMGVAWRGNVQPIQHIPDPSVNWTLPTHLQTYTISGMDPAAGNASRPTASRSPSPQILVDSVFFQLYKTGIARVWRSLLEAWLESGFAQHITILDRAGSAPKYSGYRYVTIPPYNYNQTQADRVMLQQICDEHNADLFISTYYTTPLSTPSVFMAYDMIPEVLGSNLNEPMWREKRHGITHGSAYICISHSTARDLLTHYPDIDPKTVTVAHCGVNPLFQVASPSQIQEFRQRYGIQRPYFLLVGPGAGYKNTRLFFQAFSQLVSRQGFELVCTSNAGYFPEEFRQYTSGCTVHILSLADEELSVAYSGAVALAYPSRYEGFGMPVAEALACGCPVITCPTSSLPEVAGEAALYLDPDDAGAMLEALCEVQKPWVRQQLVTAGLQQVQQFSWTTTAETVSQALIQATLQSLNLQDLNLLAFPDWSKPEDDLGAELAEAIATLLHHPQKHQLTLLLFTPEAALEEANLLLSSITMHLMMAEELDLSDGPVISLVSSLSSRQWQTLLPQIQARLPLNYEDQAAVRTTGAERLPRWDAAS